MDNPEAVKFTKTYRLFQRGGADTENIINTANSFNLQNAIDVIKFYGHSLGRADYSYFQSILMVLICMRAILFLCSIVHSAIVSTCESAMNALKLI